MDLETYKCSMTELCRRSTELLRSYRDCASAEDRRVIDGIWAMVRSKADVWTHSCAGVWALTTMQFHEEDTQTRTVRSTSDSDSCAMLESLQSPVLQQEPELVENLHTSVSRQEAELREAYINPLPFYGGLPTVVPMVSDEYYATYGTHNEMMAEPNFGIWGINSWLGNSCYMERP